MRHALEQATILPALPDPGGQSAPSAGRRGIVALEPSHERPDLAARFISIAEETGLIPPIGFWVLQAACTQLREWQTDASTRDLTLAVNVSAKQFRQPDFVPHVQRVLQKSGAKPSHLKSNTEGYVVYFTSSSFVLLMEAWDTHRFLAGGQST